MPDLTEEMSIDPIDHSPHWIPPVHSRIIHNHEIRTTPSRGRPHTRSDHFDLSLRFDHRDLAKLLNDNAIIPIGTIVV